MKYNSLFYKGDKMKVFISWSGHKSFKVATILKEWIPCVIQDIEPYFSSEDIDKGARWSTDIAKELEEASFGILCVTKENLKSEWLNFEAGALSKAIDKAKVCPFLFDLKPSDISNSPILQFQMTNVDRDDIFKLFKSMNACLENRKLEDGRLEKVFTTFWPNMDAAFKEIDKVKDKRDTIAQESEVHSDLSREMLEEMLSLLRSQQMILRDPVQLLPPSYLQDVLRTDKNIFERTLAEKIPKRLLKEHGEIRRYLIRLEDCVQKDLPVPDEMIREYISQVRTLLDIEEELFDRIGINQMIRMMRR